MSYLRWLCLFAHSGVQLLLCCRFFYFPRLVRPILPVSLDCPFLIAPSVFSNVFFSTLTDTSIKSDRVMLVIWGILDEDKQNKKHNTMC
jgi:hypothetical protein